jgi:hypothetical protein
MVSTTTTARPVAITQHHVGPRALVLSAGSRWHGVAVDQYGSAEIAVDPREQAPQRAVVGLVQGLDAPDSVIDRQPLPIDLLRIADHPRHGAEPACHSHGSGVGEGGQPALEHARIELVGLTVNVHIAARKVRPHQGVAVRDDAADELIDEGVLGTAQGRDVQAGRAQEGARIDATAVRRIEHRRTAPFARLENLEGRIELVFCLVHGGGDASI